MERKTPVGLKGVGLASLALAAALAVGPMTARLVAADAPKPTAEQVKAAEQAKQEQAKKAAAEKAKADAEKAKAAAELAKQHAEDKRAATILNEAKQAYEQKNYPQAINKYREFISQFPKRPEVGAAHYGLAIAMAEAPDKDWNVLIRELEPVVASKDIPAAEKGRAQYWLGAALRMTAEPQYTAAMAHPEQKEPLAKATALLEKALAQFTAADTALVAGVNPKPAADAKELPPALELAARAKVEAAELLVQLGKNKEAAELVKVFASDPTWKKSTQRPVALLTLGEAQVELKEYPAAFMALSQLAPFDQIGIGLHAHYLLGRVLEETGQKPEAVLEYESIAKPFLEHRRKAEEMLRNRQAMAGKHDEQLRLEAMTRGVPDYVTLASYHAANIQFDYGQYAEAAPKYIAFLQGAPKSPLAPQAQLRQGICQVQQKLPDAMRVLQPLLENPQLGDQATWWAGKLQLVLADPNNAQQHAKMVHAAIVTMTRAGDKAKALLKTDPAAAARHANILLDIADAYVSIKQYKEAAPIYETIANDASDPDRAQVASEKWAMALNKEGQYAASDAACVKFLQKYPSSMLKPSVMFWQAENSYQQGVELAKKPDANTPAVQEQIKKLQAQAATQFEAVVTKYPEFAQASAARFGLGMAYYRQGEWEKANKQLERISDADRVGDLVPASYYQADCLIHTMPDNADDALSASRLSAQLEEASKQLSGFVGSNEDRPEMPDAMLKLADCYQRNAAILADQQEKTKSLQSARETYDKLLQKYPKHPAYAQAVMDRARCIAATGDAGGAINELNRFRNDAHLVKSDIAPLALTRLSALMVKHGRAVDAAVMLEKARKDYEGILAKDPKRADWIAGLRYQQGLAYKESGKTKEALALFDGVIKEFKDRPEAAEASLASIQVRKDDAVNKLKAARQAIAGLPLDKPADAKLLTAQAEAIQQLSAIATSFGEHADRIAENAEGSDLHVRTLRDAARSWRAVAEAEIESIRRTRAEESLKKLKEKLAKDPQVGKSNSVPRPPQIKLASIPVSPAEQKAREYYNKALEAAPDSPLCNDLRLELAQLYVDRGEAEPAIQLLSAALDRNPPADQQQMLRIQLGNVYLLKKDADGAFNQAMQALTDTTSPHRPAAYLVKGKALMLKKNWGEAITLLTRYRSGAAKYLNAGPVTEEGLIRLGEAYAASGNWGESQASYEQLVGRFGGSKWVPEARFGIGYALQKAKQFDRAIEAYADVTRRTSSEVAARAQYQIGLCRAEQKRWQDAVNELLVVPGTYDYAEWAASASLEAGKALVELKQSAQAKDILQRVVRDHPGTEWAQQAQKRLAEIH
jgi:TolA-binding protein